MGEFSIRKYGERDSKNLNQADILAWFGELEAHPRKFIK